MAQSKPSAQTFRDLLARIDSNHETGQLTGTFGSTRAVLFFRDGKLIDAEIGSITGFQAVNAIAAMREAAFEFDPSVTAPSSSSITPNERIVLKQFFNIETGEPEVDSTSDEINWDLTPTQVVPLTEIMDEQNLPLLPAEPIAAQSINAPSFVEESMAEESIPPALIAPELIAEEAIEAKPIEFTEPGPQKRFGFIPSQRLVSQRSAIYLVLALLLTAAAGFALTLKLNQQRLSAPVSTAATQQIDSASGDVLNAKGENAPHESPAITESSAITPVEQRTGSANSAIAILPKQQNETSAIASVPKQENKTTADTRDVANNLSGEWNVVNVVEQTAYSPFAKMELGFRLIIKQTGNEFTAKGEKVLENGRTLRGIDRTPIHVTGSIKGDKVEATFFEQGTLRRTDGRFVWTIGNAGAGLTGTFVTTAAKSRGKSIATRDL